MEWLLALTAALKQHNVPKPLHAAVRTFFLWETRELCVYDYAHFWLSGPYDGKCPHTCAYCAHAIETRARNNGGYQYKTWFPYLSGKRIKL
jgi:hypothetical protein